MNVQWREKMEKNMLGDNWYKWFKVLLGDFTVLFSPLEITLDLKALFHFTIDFTLQYKSDIMLKVLTGQKSKENRCTFDKLTFI